MALASAAITYPDLEKRFIAWAKSSANVAGLICYGSRSTSERVVDSYSDLDLMVFSMDPEIYSSDEWLNGFGDIWISALNFTGAGDREWYIIF